MNEPTDEQLHNRAERLRQREREATKHEVIATTFAFLSVVGALTVLLGVVWICEQIVRWIRG